MQNKKKNKTGEILMTSQMHPCRKPWRVGRRHCSGSLMGERLPIRTRVKANQNAWLAASAYGISCCTLLDFSWLRAQVLPMLIMTSRKRHQLFAKTLTFPFVHYLVESPAMPCSYPALIACDIDKSCIQFRHYVGADDQHKL
ncbi:hypothetical protein Tcan_01489 [Toxocara canis]|uniref:Uncharacterized protein n=1 Tax=Toxocara canis TaxID=6265 RepID=A0A0B2UZN0_TOXCA|nr:hypothetical protein Tcan_01489 [Toxocara canis]